MAHRPRQVHSTNGTRECAVAHTKAEPTRFPPSAAAFIVSTGRTLGNTGLRLTATPHEAGTRRRASSLMWQRDGAEGTTINRRIPYGTTSRRPEGRRSVWGRSEMLDATRGAFTHRCSLFQRRSATLGDREHVWTGCSVHACVRGEGSLTLTPPYALTPHSMPAVQLNTTTSTSSIRGR